jgi:hypothetical protein
LRDFSWIALAVAIVVGMGTTLYLRRRAVRADVLLADNDPTTNPSPADDIAAVAVHSASDAARNRRREGPPHSPASRKATAKRRPPRPRRG